MLSILSLITVFIATYYTYKNASDTNRNAGRWALLTFAVGFGFQIIVPGIILFIIAFAMTPSGKPLTMSKQFPWSIDIIISLLGLLASFIGIWLIMRHVSTIPDEEVFNAPPVPPNFDEKR
jgi:uncharacterized membrane protein